MDSHVAQCRYLLSLAAPVLDGLGQEHLALEPYPRAKTAGWLIGHLAITGDFARRLCGRPPLCPREWRQRFSPGSQPSIRPDDYPPVSELCDAFRAVYTDLCEAALTCEGPLLAAENSYQPSRAAFPTAGDFVGYLLAGHLAYHVGQLVAWRAAARVGTLDRDQRTV